MKYFIALSILLLATSTFAQQPVNTCTVPYEDLPAPNDDLILKLCGYISRNEEVTDGIPGFEAIIFSWMRDENSALSSGEQFPSCIKEWIEKFYLDMKVQSSSVPKCDFNGHAFNAFAKLSYPKFWDRMLNVHQIDVELLNTPVPFGMVVRSVAIGKESSLLTTPLDITEYEILANEGTISVYSMNDLIQQRDRLIAYGVRNAVDIDPNNPQVWSPTTEQRWYIVEFGERVKKEYKEKVDENSDW
ncbi:MAG: hypothetical protein RLN90_14595 [Balneolaceae bacterium]